MKENIIEQAFNYLDTKFSCLYAPSNFYKRKNFICQIKYNYWFLTIRYNMYSFIKENPESKTREEFKFNSSAQLEVAVGKDSDINKVLAFIVSRINYITFVKNNNFRDEGTNLKEVFSSINDYYVENTYLYQNLLKEDTMTIKLADPIFAPLQTRHATIRPELRQSNHMTREQIDEFFRDRISESVHRLADQAQRTITINNDVTVQLIREQLERLSERVEAMRVERNNNE